MSIINFPVRKTQFHDYRQPKSRKVCLIHFLGKLYRYTLKAGNSTQVTASLNWAHMLQTQKYAHTQAPRHTYSPGLALWVHNLCGQSPLFGSMFLASSWNSETVHRKLLVFHVAAGPPDSGTSPAQRTRLHNLELECLNTQPWNQISIWILVSELSQAVFSLL